MSYSLKRVDEVIQLAVDFSGDLVSPETISTQIVQIEPVGLIAGSVTITANVVAADFSDGIAGDSYRVQFQVTTSAGRVYEKEQTVRIKP